MEDLNDRTKESGFSLIEVLIAICIFSVGFMAITASVIAASGMNRTTAVADQAIFWGQHITECLAGIPMDAPDLDIGRMTVARGDRKAEITVFDPVDLDGNGRNDFKTIGLKVWVKKGDSFSLRLENYYRRPLKN